MNEENPFYRNYVFSSFDLDRTIKWRHYLMLIFRPMYVQISEGYAVHFKTTADGRIFIFKMEELTNDDAGL